MRRLAQRRPHGPINTTHPMMWLNFKTGKVTTEPKPVKTIGIIGHISARTAVMQLPEFITRQKEAS